MRASREPTGFLLAVQSCGTLVPAVAYPINPERGSLLLRERLTVVGETAALLLVKDVLDTLGITMRDEVELSLIDRALMRQLLDEVARGQQLAAITHKVCARRESADPQLAQGPVEWEGALFCLCIHAGLALQAWAIEAFGGGHGVHDAGALAAAPRWFHRLTYDGDGGVCVLCGGCRSVADAPALEAIEPLGTFMPLIEIAMHIHTWDCHTWRLFGSWAGTGAPAGQ